MRIFQFGVGVPNGVRLSSMLSIDWLSSMYMLLVDFSNAFNMLDRSTMLKEVLRRCPLLSPLVELCYVCPARQYYNEPILLSS